MFNPLINSQLNPAIIISNHSINVRVIEYKFHNIIRLIKIFGQRNICKRCYDIILYQKSFKFRCICLNTAKPIFISVHNREAVRNNIVDNFRNVSHSRQAHLKSVVVDIFSTVEKLTFKCSRFRSDQFDYLIHIVYRKLSSHIIQSFLLCEQ